MSKTLRSGYAITPLLAVLLVLAGCNRNADSTAALPPTDSSVATNTAPAPTAAPTDTTTPPAATTPPATTTADAPPAAGTAPNATTPTDTVAAALAPRDRKFIEQTAAHGMYELEVASLAANRATDPQVRTYAAMLVSQHSTANSELAQLARAKGVTLPTALPNEQRKDIEKLNKESAADFDKRFVQMVGIKQHKEDIDRFEDASKSAKDPELKAWVDKTLPALRDHLSQAKSLKQSA